jgi:ABC-type glycerol-3-phosphate transport system permease component
VLDVLPQLVCFEARRALVTMAVPLAVFLLLQRFFVRGIIAGSVKR